jgi:hypothetical protein
MTIKDALVAIHTLWTRKNACFRALGKSTVELGGELGVSDAAQVVVCLNIFLDGLPTACEAHTLAKSVSPHVASHLSKRTS